MNNRRRSRYPALVLAALLAVSLNVTPSGAEVGGGGSGAVGAAAYWWTPDGDRGTLHFVKAYRGVHSNFGFISFAYFGALRCHVVKGNPRRCKGKIKATELQVTDFVIDPMLSSAHLEFEFKGKSTEIAWTATEPIEANHGPHNFVDQGEYRGEPYVEAGAGGYVNPNRRATASGRLLGKRVFGRTLFSGYLGIGVEANGYACAGTTYCGLP